MSMSTDIETFGPAAGLTRGGFYNHFASKDALVDTDGLGPAPATLPVLAGPGGRRAQRNW